ncbi:MAG: tetratricopeptide repeat protein [Phycisphaerae bacterium]|nr:tetratricopeptide repeat protein [Phycisphaerae bacterium]
MVDTVEMPLGKALLTAVEHHKSGELALAKQFYEKIIEANPDHKDANHLLGVIAGQEGHHELAVERIQKVLQSYPDFPEANNNIGTAYKALGQTDKAVEHYRKAIAAKPDYADPYNNFANLLREKGLLEEAAENYRKAVQISPENISYQDRLGNILSDIGKSEEAVEVYKKALERHPDSPRLYNNMGIALENLGKREEAFAAYKKAVDIDSDYAKAYSNLGRLLSMAKMFDESFEHHKKALLLDPENPHFHNNLANAYKKLDKMDDAIAHYNKAISIKPDYTVAYCHLGSAYCEAGDFDNAARFYEKALSLAPDFTVAYRQLTSLYTYTKCDEHTKRMEQLYKDQDLTDDQRMHLCFGLGKVFEDLKEYEKSFEFIAEGNRIKRSTFEYSVAKSDAFFEKIKSVFNNEFFENRKDIGYMDPTPIFILGLPRSGTTLVEQIMASHSDVFGAGEISEILRQTNNIKTNDKEFPEVVCSLNNEDFARIGANYVSRIRRYSTDARYITNKMPGNFMMIGFIKSILPNAKIIHCKRNPMDNCLSIFKNFFSTTHEYACDLTELGQYYNYYLEVMEHWRDLFGDFMIEVQYEKLVKKQRSQTQKILKYCNLQWEDNCLEFYKTKRSVATSSASQVRHPIYKSSVNSWKNYEKQLEPLKKALEKRA